MSHVPFGPPPGLDPALGEVNQLCVLRRSKSGKTLWAKDGPFGDGKNWASLRRRDGDWVLDFGAGATVALRHEGGHPLGPAFTGFWFRLCVTVIRRGDVYPVLLSALPLKPRRSHADAYRKFQEGQPYEEPAAAPEGA